MKRTIIPLTSAFAAAAVLAAAIAIFSTRGYAGEKLEKAAGKTFFLYPAVEGKAGDKGCIDFLGRCMLFQTDKPVLQLSDVKFKARLSDSPGRHNQIELFFNKEQSRALEKISEKYSGEGKRLAVVYKDKVLHAPKLKAKIKANGVMIDFCNAKVFKIVLASLRGELPPSYNFNDDKTFNMCDPDSEK